MGFLNVAIFIMAPEQVPQDLKEVAGFVAVIGINIGTIIGGFSSLTLKNLGGSGTAAA
jgi:hypothetical protein